LNPAAQPPYQYFAALQNFVRRTTPSPQAFPLSHLARRALLLSHFFLCPFCKDIPITYMNIAIFPFMQRCYNK
jgi:hypothetical protein